MRLIIGMGKGNTNDEIMDYFDLNPDCILACDGCHVVYTTNSEIIEDFNKPHLIDYKGYNHMHLNGFVDVISKAFIDVVIQPGQKPDEPSKYIITADRGYESYDLLFHCELKHLSYVFRVKAPSSPKSILSYYKNELPDEQDEFNLTIKRFLTDKKRILCGVNLMFIVI